MAKEITYDNNRILRYDKGKISNSTYIKVLDDVMAGGKNNPLRHSLDTIANEYSHDADEVHEKNLSLYQQLDNLRGIKGAIAVSKELSKNYEHYSKLVSNINQIESIEIINDPYYNDMVERHKSILKVKVKRNNDFYQKLFTRAESCYKSLDDKEKDSLTRLAKTYINKSRSLDIIQHESIIGSLAAGVMGAAALGAAFTFLFKDWFTISASIVGMSLLLYAPIRDTLLAPLKFVTNTIVLSFIIYLVTVVSIYLYGLYRDRKNKKLNEPINALLDKVNIDSANGKPYRNINSEEESKESTETEIFRGFGNQAGYKPADNSSKENDKHGIF